MKNKWLSLLFGVAVLGSSTAQAAITYTYSYRFDFGQRVFGTFDGDGDGNLIRNLTNITINYAVDDIQPPRDFSSSPALSSYRAIDRGKTDYTQGGIASLNGLENAFLFVDPVHPYNYLYLFSATPYYDARKIDVQHGYNGEDFYQGDTFFYNRWHVSPVPEPASITMLLAGMLLFVGMFRSKRAVDRTAGRG